jgi:hypothetical protein
MFESMTASGENSGLMSFPYIINHIVSMRNIRKMNHCGLIEQISMPDADIVFFAALIIREKSLRDEVIHQMVSNPDIMVYYQCYYVAAKASFMGPELFYGYWDEIAELLKHPNSYHRNFALEILANLTKVDTENRFLPIFSDYFKLLYDPKFLTGLWCVRSCQKVIENEKELLNQIISLLLEVEQNSLYKVHQIELLKFDILETFDKFYPEINDKIKINEFITLQIRSTSPKTRKRAKELVSKYHLIR